MSYRIIIDNFDADYWQMCAASFMDYNLYQTWAYQDVRSKKEKQSASRFVILSEQDTPCLMGQVRIRKSRFTGLRVGYIQWGPLCRKPMGVVDDAVALFDLLRSTYIPSRVNVLRITPNIFDTECEHLIADLQNAGFLERTHIRPYQTMLFPLDTDEKGIRGRFHAGWRRYLNKAQNDGLQTQQGTDSNYVGILRELYSGLTQRKDFKGLRVEIFERTQKQLTTAEKMNLVLACRDKLPLTVQMTSHLGDTALGILAASSEKALQFHSTYLVWWHTLLAAKHAGVKRYDLGGVDPEKNPKVYQFKQRMGAIEARHIGVFEACSSPPIKYVWRVAEKVYNTSKRR